MVRGGVGLEGQIGGGHEGAVRRRTKLVFDGKSFRDLLLIKPLSSVTIEPWWMVQVGYITEEDVGSLTRPQQTVVGQIIDQGPCQVIQLAYRDVHSEPVLAGPLLPGHPDI